MARFFRLPVVPEGFIGEHLHGETHDWLLNSETVSDVSRVGKKVIILRKENLGYLTLNFENEDQAKDFLNQNFLIFNA